MCEFFSFVTEPNKYPGQKFYFDWNYREENLKNKKISSDHFDSHSSICAYHNLKEDDCNKYEFNPLTKKLKIDKINSEIDDRVQVENWVNKLNYKKILKPLIVKEIIIPFSLPEFPKENINDDIILLLKKWSLLSDRNWRIIDNTWIKLVGAYPASTIANTIRSFIWNSFPKFLFDKNNNTIESIYGYIASFFDVDYNIDITSINKLWDMGLLPIFDENNWKLYSGKNGNVVFQIKESDLSNFRIR